MSRRMAASTAAAHPWLSRRRQRPLSMVAQEPARPVAVVRPWTPELAGLARFVMGSGDEVTNSE